MALAERGGEGKGLCTCAGDLKVEEFLKHIQVNGLGAQEQRAGTDRAKQWSEIVTGVSRRVS